MTTMNGPVDIVVRGRHIELSQRFREHVVDKLGRVDRFGVTLSRVDVEVTKEANPRQADRAFEVELTCVGRGPVVRAEATAADKYAALDLAYGRRPPRPTTLRPTSSTRTVPSWCATRRTRACP